MFNALKYIKNLEQVGFQREQAEAQVQLVIDSFEENVATKSDISEVKFKIAQVTVELKGEIASVKSELREEIASVKSELYQVHAELRADMAHLKSDLITKLGGLMALSTGVLGFLIKF